MGWGGVGWWESSRVKSLRKILAPAVCHKCINPIIVIWETNKNLEGESVQGKEKCINMTERVSSLVLSLV